MALLVTVLFVGCASDEQASGDLAAEYCQKAFGCGSNVDSSGVEECKVGMKEFFRDHPGCEGRVEECTQKDACNDFGECLGENISDDCPIPI